MELELSETYKDFKAFIRLLKAVCEEATLQIDAEGIHVREMDPSHVAMIEAVAKPELFDAFNAPTAEKMTINLEEFLKFLDRVNEKEEGTRVKIFLDKENMKLKIQVTKGKHTRTFSMAILDRGEQEGAPSPKILFKAHARIITENFRRGIKDALLVSEHVKLEYTKDAFKLSAKGDIGDAESDWERGSDDLLDLKMEEDAHATFTLSFLNDIMDAMLAVVDIVEVDLSTDMPCKMRGEGTAIEIAYYLAPCIGV